MLQINTLIESLIVIIRKNNYSYIYTAGRPYKLNTHQSTCNFFFFLPGAPNSNDKAKFFMVGEINTHPAPHASDNTILRNNVPEG